MRTRRSFLLIPALFAYLSAAAPARGSEHALIRAIDAIGFTVADMDSSVRFFSNVLSFEKTADRNIAGTAYEELQGVPGLRMRVVRMRLGDETLELTEYVTPRGNPIPRDSRSNDRWFQHIAIIVSDMDRAYAWLRQHDVEHVSRGPQRLPEWNKNAAGIRAFYFKDPDGHPLEILEFPPDKGAAKWHQTTDRLFLGIDHTAIVVDDTEATLTLYRDALGLSLAAENENYGIEQERLNNVEDARLRITALRAAAGPGIELLEYLTPRNGRAAPAAGVHAHDIAHWQIRMTSRDAQRAEVTLHTANVHFVSPGMVEMPTATLGFQRGALIRDRDGHALQIVIPSTDAGSTKANHGE